MGRRIWTEEEAVELGYGHPDFTRRREVLRETLAAFEEASPHHYDRIAASNLQRWKLGAQSPPQGQVDVIQGDWGDVALLLTKRYGEHFAVLNMANSYTPGGGYVEGMPAQEENLYRRTNCHFHITSKEVVPSGEQYIPEMTTLIGGFTGKVFLDNKRSRICLRGPEDMSREDLGYDFLGEEDIFPFYELRASAQDLRYEGEFDLDEARWRIDAQLNTLVEKEVRFAVLSAFGCGAFGNPADQVAKAYRDALEARKEDFALIAFAIFYPGYGEDNFPPFKEAFLNF